MHGEVDLAREKRALDFADEEALATNCSEWPILDPVACSADRY